MTQKLKAVLFDLDDTLFDHQYCYRTSLRVIYDRFEALQISDFSRLESVYQDILEEFHARAVSGEITLQEARVLRMQAIFANYDVDITLDEAYQIDEDQYRYTYTSSRRPVPGARSLIERIRECGLKIGIITNHVPEEQIDKLATIGLTELIDVMVTSGEVGVSKPDPHIFNVLLDALECKPEETVLVGDSWESDIVGATNLGIRAIWLNRYGSHSPDPSLAEEIHALEPVEDVLKTILGE